MGIWMYWNAWPEFENIVLIFVCVCSHLKMRQQKRYALFSSVVIPACDLGGSLPPSNLDKFRRDVWVGNLRNGVFPSTLTNICLYNRPRPLTFIPSKVCVPSLFPVAISLELAFLEKTGNVVSCATIVLPLTGMSKYEQIIRKTIFFINLQ